jgi:choline dehydrogenase-like flavoprotein
MFNKNIYNYLIVGSGPGGAATAHELSKSSKNIILIEKGSYKNKNHKQYSPEEINRCAYQSGISSTFGKGGLTYTTGTCVGGGSEINSGFYYELPLEIFKKWKKIIKNLDYEVIKKNFYEIKKKLGVNKIKKEGLSSQILLKGSKKLKLVSEIVPRWIKSSLIIRNNKKIWKHRRYSMSNTYLKEAINRGVELVANCEAQKIEKISNNLFKVICFIKDKKIVFYSKKIFICAGPIFSPLLLIKSGYKKNIGTNLNFHQMTRIVAEFKDDINEDDFGVPVRQLNHFKKDLTIGCSVSSKKHLAVWCADHDNLFSIIENYKKYATYYSLITSESKGKIVAIKNLRDPIIFYDITEKDIKKHHKGLRILSKILFLGGAKKIIISSFEFKKKTLKEFFSYNELDLFLRKNKSFIPELSSIHIFSSIPMGDKEIFPLTDQGELKEEKNIFINDASMLPSYTSVNPQAIIMAFAIRNVKKILSNE